MKHLLATLVITSCFVGCKTIEYTDPSGRHLKIVSPPFFDTQMGALKASDSPDGVKVEIENYSAQQSQTQALREAIGKIPSKP